MPSSGNLPMISVIIVSYNSKEELSNCLASLQKKNFSGKFEIIIVDNASTDGSVSYVKDHFPSVKVIMNKYNMGYGGACNIGAQFAQGDYLVLLNQDTKVDKAWLFELVKVLSSDKSIGACSSQILFWNGDKTQNLGGLYNPESGYGVDIGFGETTNDASRKPYKVFYGSGASLMVRSQTFKEVGGFDADYFLYFDEVDLCWRIRLLGYEVYIVPTSLVYHKIDPLRAHSSKHRFFVERNSLQTIIKNYELKNFIKFGLLVIMIRIWGVVFLTIKGKIKYSLAILKGVYYNIQNLRKIWLKRQLIQEKRIVTDKALFEKHLILTLPLLLRMFRIEVAPFLD